MNNDDSTRNNTAMQTSYPSKPSILNGFAGLGIGGGTGHVCSQSTQAHGNDDDCLTNRIQIVIA